MLIVDDEADVTITFKAGIEESNNNNGTDKRIEVYTSNNPIVALSEFKPNFYDLLLVDINMPHMNGFELWEKILAIDINVKVCYMSSAEINREALREIYPSIGLGYLFYCPTTFTILWFVIYQSGLVAEGVAVTVRHDVTFVIGVATVGVWWW